MKFIQLIKKVNNTELGKGGTHETYVLVPQDADVSDLFVELDKKYAFIDKMTGKIHELRLTSGREKRIVGLGPFYREHDVSAGDEVLFEKRFSLNGSEQYFITVNRFLDTVVLQKKRDAFAVLTPERLNSILDKELEDNLGKKVEVKFCGEFKLRGDSPDTTKLYDIFLEERRINAQYANNDMMEIFVKEDKVTIRCFRPWKKYYMEVSE